MSASQWQGDGPDFTIEASGRSWRLNVEDSQPGLTWSAGRSLARLLALQGVATSARRDDSAFDVSSMTAFEHHRNRIQATFLPRDWRGLTVRAAWEPSHGCEGFDLEIQASSSSFEVLRGLEVTILSRWMGFIGPSPPEWISGVEMTEVAEPAFPPRVFREPGAETGRFYVEMIRPDDCLRRIQNETPSRQGTDSGAFAIRHVLFGHDLEKGVVLRGRIRGVWIDADPPDDEVRRLYERFLDEPPSLGP